MKNFRISIQEKIKAFNKNGLIGETTLESIEEYCKKNSISMPMVWSEQDSQTIEIVKKYFLEN